MAVMARRLSRHLLYQYRDGFEPLKPFSFGSSSFGVHERLCHGLSSLDLDHGSAPHNLPELDLQQRQSPSNTFSQERSSSIVYDSIVDAGIYKAILVGMLGSSPVQKELKNGRNLTQMIIGTGGIKNNRRPLEDEDPRDYANRSSVLWHRVVVHSQNLGRLILKSLEPGSIVYVEGNIETKVFIDSLTGLVRRVREVAVRRNGRVVFLGQGNDMKATPVETRNVGHY